MRRIHFHSTRALAALLCLLGVAMIVTTLARGGGPLSVGVVMGAVFTAFGAARLYLAAALRGDR